MGRFAFSLRSEDKDLTDCITSDIERLADVVPPPRRVTVLITDRVRLPGMLAATYQQKLIVFYVPVMRAERSELRQPRHYMPCAWDNLHGHLVHHEWAHLFHPRDFIPMHALKNADMETGAFGSTLALPREVHRALSLYGQTQIGEAYAECFSEFYMTSGQTRNEAARWFAEKYDWRL